MRKREELIHQRAYELAISAFHINSIPVFTALVQEGFEAAGEMALADLRDVYARHWRGVTVPEPVAILPAAGEGQPDLIS